MMENSGPLVLDISSDEESGFGEPRKDCGYGVGEFGDAEDCDWLSRLLVEVGGKKDDDSDDVVVVSEVLANPPKRQRNESLKPTTEVVCEEVDDDDCVVLDADPDKPVVVVNAKADDGDTDDSDDLEIVGEKGEVACRDFPHARYLCAKFVFASTAHEVHCSQCHCYVCDSLAPCPHWGTGLSSIDHCHANDKEEYWKAERKRMKKGDKHPTVVSSTNHTPCIETLFTPRVQALAPPQPNSLPQNHGSSAVRINPFHMPSNVSGKNAVNQGRVLPSGCVPPRYKPQSQFVACNNNVASMAKQSIPRPPVFKRHGPHRAARNNRLAYGSQLSRAPSLKRSHAFQTPAIIRRHGPNQLNIGTAPARSILPQQNIGASQYQVHSQAYSSCLSRDPMHSAPQTSFQPHGSSSFVNTVPLQPQVGQPSVENFEDLILPEFHVEFQGSSPLPSQPFASCQTDASNSIRGQLHSRPMNTSNSEEIHYVDNQSLQPPGHAMSLMDVHIGIQQENHTQNSVGTSPTDFGLAWECTPSHGNLQIHAESSQYLSAAPADNSQLQSVGNMDQYQSTAPLDNFNQKSIVVADDSSVINDTFCHFPESTRHDSLDFQFDGLMFENQNIPSFEVPASPVWNVFSPEPASGDPVCSIADVPYKYNWFGCASSVNRYLILLPPGVQLSCPVKCLVSTVCENCIRFVDCVSDHLQIKAGLLHRLKSKMANTAVLHLKK